MEKVEQNIRNQGIALEVQVQQPSQPGDEPLHMLVLKQFMCNLYVAGMDTEQVVENANVFMHDYGHGVYIHENILGKPNQTQLALQLPFSLWVAQCVRTASDELGLSRDQQLDSDGDVGDVRAQIERDFTYHAPKSDQPQRYNQLREKAKEFALLIADLVPHSKERDEALMLLNLSVMSANAAIARHE